VPRLCHEVSYVFIPVWTRSRWKSRKEPSQDFVILGQLLLAFSSYTAADIILEWKDNADNDVFIPPEQFCGCKTPWTCPLGLGKDAELFTRLDEGARFEVNYIDHIFGKFYELASRP